MIIKRFLLPAATFLMVAAGPAAFTQTSGTEDSLRAAIRKYDAGKGGAGASLSLADTIKADLLAELVVVNYIDKPEVALRDARQQYLLSKKIGYKWGMARAFEMQGNIYEYRRDYDKAIDYYIKSLSLYREEGSLNSIDVFNNIGVTYSKKGVFTEALKYLLQGLDMSRKANDVRGLISTYNNIGIIYSEQQKHDEALSYYFKCLRLQLRQKEQYGTSHTYHNIGRIYAMKNQAEPALKNFMLGLEHARKEKDDISLANNYSGIGNLYLESGEYKKAIEYHEPALKLREKINDSYGLVTSLSAFAKIYHKTGDDAKALQYAERALLLVKSSGELDMLADCYELLAAINASVGMYKAAYDNYKLYKRYSDSLFNADIEKKLVQQQMNFDFKNIQEEKDRHAHEALERQKNIRNYTIGGLIAAVIAVIIYLVRRHRRNILKRQREYTEGLDGLQQELSMKEIETQSLKIENENIQLKNNLVAIEREYEQKEREKLEETLESNKRELASTTLYLYQKNQKLSELNTELNALKQGNISFESLQKIKSKIQENIYLDADWDKFKLHFEQVHPNFFSDLDLKHPGLTTYEVRLYAYLHMKLSTKEIAALLNITPASVMKAKTRLNKKLKKDKDEQ